MKIYNLFYGCLLLMAFPVWSQTWEDKGHKQFKNLAYSDAIISLENAVEKGNRNGQIYEELANAYYFTANYQASAKWFQILFKSSEKQSAIYFLRYAQTLKTIRKHAAAKTVLNKMMVIYPQESSRFKAFLENDEANPIKNADRFEVKLATFNSAQSDFGTSYFGSHIVFASTRDTGSIFKREHSWTNESFTDLYVVDFDSATAKLDRFPKQINSKFNESSAIFTKDGLTMYFTRNNFQEKKIGLNDNKTSLLKIYKAEIRESKWTVIGALPFCSDAYNTAHPALSPDEKVFYFASDMPGGFGQSDLYQVEILEDGTFGKPENLGPSINTLGRETFPFVNQKDELYFASDAHEGFGGLDVFVSMSDESGGLFTPKNVGKPVNSSMDDFGFIINSESASGFFTSNRSGGLGSDDIYAFYERFPMSFENILEGSVAVEDRESSLAGIDVILLDDNAVQIDKTTTDDEGNYFFKINSRKNYIVLPLLEGHTSDTIIVKSKSNIPTVLQKLFLQKEKMNFQLGDDLAKKLALLPIYFDLSKSEIRQDAATELAKVKKVLLEYSNLTIEVRSHTDSRDTFENNQKLSNGRAKATLDWLIQNGIDANRITALGFGETRLINFCADDVPCSEEAHQMNRRSEFIVTGI